MTNTEQTSTAAAVTFEAAAGEFGGYVVLEQGEQDGWPYTVQTGPLFGTLADAQDFADHLNRESRQ